MMHLVWIAWILSLTLLVSLLVPILQAAITVRAGFLSVGRLKSQKEMFQIVRRTSDKAPPAYTSLHPHTFAFLLSGQTHRPPASLLAQSATFLYGGRAQED